ncbi:transcription factor MYC2 [Vigna unguiculata]|uniref:Transcription factor MYC2 n=1 Tax=Vigna unguiculata TaxID=3917 RepID=A0A4D6L1C3_VIGUN|nr:transcription factor MYC2 [Vigna unguiculata]
MSGLGVVHWLRPLVETNVWDYVVLWKYGDDPTRFIEWIGCCCRGSCSMNIGVEAKEEKGEECRLAPICRDDYLQHHVRTKACEALAQLPFALSLYSGVHGEVAISQQSRWLTKDSIGTQVLVPVVGGLIELFSEKLIPMDMNIIEFITAHGCVSLKQEAISAQSYTSLNIIEHLPLREQYSHWWLPHMSTTLTPIVHQPPTKQCTSHPSIEGPPSGSNPSTEEPSFDSKFVGLIPDEYLKQSDKMSPIPKTKMPKYNKTSGKQQRGLSSHCSDGEEGKSKLVKEPQKEGYQAKNLVTERNRRNKIKKGLFTLRSLVPKITKMDRAAILADAVDYIKELQAQVKELKDEARALEVQDSENTPQLRKTANKEQEGTRSNTLNQSSSDCTKNMQMEVQAEVHHIGKKDFLIKLYCEQKQGRFSKLMEAIHSIGLQVASANMTTFDDKVLNILTVKATKKDIQPTKLKEYLIQKTSEDRQSR